MKKVLFLFLVIYFLTPNITFGDNGIHFTENLGQWPKQVNFKTNVTGGQIWLEKNRISYQFTKYPNLHANFESKEKAIVNQHVVWANFIGSNVDYKITKKEKSKDYTNYFIGNDKSKWASNAHSYNDITYNNFYSNIDLRIYKKEGLMKYDFIVKPGGKNDIKIKYEGQSNIEINKNGEITIYTSLGQIIEEKPYAYQLINGKPKKVDCKFILKKGFVSFSIGKYDKSINLIIDPVLIFASYNGSPSDNFGMTATYDENGNLYTGGTIFGANYPITAGVYDPLGNFSTVNPSGGSGPGYGVSDVFISKYEPNGTSLLYSTYLGGGNDIGGTETVNSLICDSLGNLHLFGNTSSSDFPISVSAYQDTLMGGTYQQFLYNGSSFWDNNHIGGGTDIYVTKFNSTGSALLGSTYIGGTENDGLNYNLSSGNYSSSAAYDSLSNNYGDQSRGEIMIDELGFIYITSSTYSSDFPIVNGFQNTIGGQQDGIICKFSPNLDNLIWSSFIGGTDKDAGYSIKVTANKDVIITGGTCSSNFPTTTGTINPNFLGGITDGYIAKIDKNGGSIITSTFIGGNLYDQCYFIEVDRFNSVYVVGQTKSNLPVFNAAYSNPNSGAFIMKLDSNLTTINYSTLFGNGDVNAEFSPAAFLVDRCQNVYISGWGGNLLPGGLPLTGMPITTNAFQPNSANGYDFYLFVMERDAQSQLYGTYFGGNQSDEHVDGGTSRFDKNGIIYQSVCAGCGNNDDFPTTTGAVSNINQSTNCNNGVFKFDFEIIPEAEFVVDTFQGCAPLTITFSNSSGNSDTYLWDFGNGDTTSIEFNPIRTYNTPGVYQVSLLIQDSICNTVDTAFQTITVSPPITITGGNTVTTCDTATLSVNTTGGFANFIWSSNNQFTDTLNTNLSDSSLFVNLTDTTWYFVMATNGICFAIDSFLVNYTGFQIQINNASTCQGKDVVLQANTTSNYTLTYSWTPTVSIISGANTATPTVNPNATTTYTSTAQNSFGCLASDTAQVVVSGFNPSQINITADEDTLFGGTGTYLHVTPNTGFTYFWSPSGLVDNPTSSDPFANPKETTTYTVQLTETATGCIYTITYTLYLFEINCDEPDIFLPNAFTPNNDNENDILFVRGNYIDKMNLKIYDRWGELVFETDKQSVGWDGTFKGRLVEPAVYVYYLTLTCLDEQEFFKKGNITVIR